MEKLIINLSEPKRLSKEARALLTKYRALLNTREHYLFNHVNTARVEVLVTKSEFESLTFRIKNVRDGNFLLVEVSFITNSVRVLGSDRFNHRLAHKNTVEKLCFLTEEIGGIKHV